MFEEYYDIVLDFLLKKEGASFNLIMQWFEGTDYLLKEIIKELMDRKLIAIGSNDRYIITSKGSALLEYNRKAIVANVNKTAIIKRKNYWILPKKLTVADAI